MTRYLSIDLDFFLDDLFPTETNLYSDQDKKKNELFEYFKRCKSHNYRKKIKIKVPVFLWHVVLRMSKLFVFFFQIVYFANRKSIYK